MNTSPTVTIIKRMRAAAASHSWMRCRCSASRSIRSRAFMTPRRLSRVFFVELARRLAFLFQRRDGVLDVGRHPPLHLGEIGVRLRDDLDALRDFLVATKPFRRLPLLAEFLRCG